MNNYRQTEIISYSAKITSGKKRIECPLEEVSVICNSQEDEIRFVNETRENLQKEFPKATEIEIYPSLRYKK